MGASMVAALLPGLVALAPSTEPASEPAPTVTASEDIRPPSAPVLVHVVPVVGHVALHWTYPSDTGGDPPSHHTVHRRPVGGSWTVLGRTFRDPESGADPIAMWVDATAPANVVHEYAISSGNLAGEGPRGVSHAVATARTDVVGTVRGQVVAAPFGGRLPVELTPPDQHHAQPSPSPDGRRLATVRRRPDGGTDLEVRPWRGGSPRWATALADDVADPTWTPDGRTLLFTRLPATGAPSVWSVPAAGGTPVRVATSARHPAVAPDGTVVVTDLSGSTPRLARITGGTRTTIRGTAGGREPSLSPDGRTLAFVRTSGSEPAQLAVVPTAGATEVDGTGDGTRYARPSWRADGRRVVAHREPPNVRTEDVEPWVPFEVTPGPPLGLVRRSGGVRSWEVIPSVDPRVRSLGVHLVDPPLLTGPAPPVRFAVSDAPAGTTSTCRLGTGSPRSCTSPWSGQDLSSGRAELTVTTTEPDGRRSTVTHVWTVDATPPSVRTTGPSGWVTLGPRATVTWTASDQPAGVASHDVRTRRARADGGYQAYQRPDALQATTRTSASIALSRGHEHCAGVRSRDRVGNRSGWTPDRCTSRPLDDRSLSASSAWRRVEDARALDGTLTRTSTAGATLTRRGVQARQLALIATTCPDCGRVEVRHGATVVGTVDLRSSTTRRQVVLPLPRASSVRTGDVTLRVTTSGRPVHVDGLAVRRS